MTNAATTPSALKKTLEQIITTGYMKSKLKTDKTAYQPSVSATEFMNNKRLYTLFKTFFFLKAYQNPYVKPYVICQEFTQRRWQQ